MHTYKVMRYFSASEEPEQLRRDEVPLLGTEADVAVGAAAPATHWSKAVLISTGLDVPA